MVKKSMPLKRRLWLKILALILGVLVVLVVIAYFVVTSSGFFKGVILPRVSQAVGATITVDDASISPFSQVVLTGLKVQTTGEKPLLTAKEVRARYRLWAIIHGRVSVDEVAIVSPVINVVNKADGTSNLDPLRKKFAEEKSAREKTSKEKKPSAASRPLQVDVKKISITHVALRSVQEYAGGKSDFAEISDLNLSIAGIKNGQTAKLTLSANGSLARNPPDAKQAGLLEAVLNGDFSFALTDDLKPASLTGGLQLNISKATGAMADLAALTASMQSEVTPTEIKQLALRFQRGGVKLGEVFVSGPFNLAKSEGRFSVEARSIDRQVLNLAGAATGIDFGTTTLNSTNQIELANAGQAITAAGRFDVGKFQVTRSGQTTPTLDLNANYQVTVDLNTKTGLLHSLTVNGEQNRAQLLHAELTSPMNFAWGETSVSMGDSALNVALNNLNLADWKTFVGDLFSSGIVNANVKLLTQKGDKKLTFDLTSAIENLSASAGGNKISQAGVSLTTHGQALDFKQFQFDTYQLQITRQKQSVLSLSGSGSYNLTNQTADLQVDLQADLPHLLAAFPQPDASAQSGTVRLKAHVTQKQNTQTVNGNLVLADFTGAFGNNTFRSYGSDVSLDLAKDNQLIQLRQVAGKLSQSGNAGGGFNVSGQYDVAHQSGQFTVKLDGLNENAVRPFLEPLLADKKLVSVSINATASAQYNPQGASSVKADLQVANLQVNDPKGQLPATPLAAKLQLDTSLEKQVANVRQFQITLTPTSRGKNEVQLSGRVDMSRTNAIQGTLKLLADSLDLTSYYDLFAGPSKTPVGNQASTPTPSSTPAQPETEPAAIILPFQKFVAEVNIGRLYLHEVEITNFQTTVKLDGGRVQLNPFKLWLNGAPVTANVDLDRSMPGYQYDVTLNADNVPLAPLVNTFQPDRKGQIGGTTTVRGQIKGAGVTGASLQKNLTGQFEVTSTNMNLAVINVRNRLLTTTINAIVAIPDLIRNPASTVTDLLGGALSGRPNNGFTGKLSSAPINVIELRGTAGNGIVNMQRTLVQSSAFQAEAPGTVTLAAVLNDSRINFPVTVSLERSLAEELNLLPANTPTNAVYAQLPKFLTITGTIGNSKPKTDALALAAVAIKAGTGVVNSILNAVNGVTTNTAPNSSTNKPSKQEKQQQQINEGINLLQDLLAPPKKKN